MLPIFTATRPEQVPARCRSFISVDGAVPGAAVTWDHHQTGERINLEAMPAQVDLRLYDGVATTLPDTDALASVVAVLMGGVGRLPPHARAVLESASHHCDHLLPHPDHAEPVNALGRGLDNYVGGSLAAVPRSRRSGRFSRLCRQVLGDVRAGRPLPSAEHPARAEAVAMIEAAGGLTMAGALLVVDTRVAPRGGSVRPDAWYLARPACQVAVIIDRHPRGGARYTLGHNPFQPVTIDVRPILSRLAEAEFALGPPALAPRADAGCENWGGRREVGGSPWNYGSRLTVAQVTGVVLDALGQ